VEAGEQLSLGGAGVDLAHLFLCRAGEGLRLGGEGGQQQSQRAEAAEISEGVHGETVRISGAALP